MKKGNYPEKRARSSHQSTAESRPMIQRGRGVGGLRLYIGLYNLQSAYIIPFHLNHCTWSRHHQPHFSDEDTRGQRESETYLRVSK